MVKGHNSSPLVFIHLMASGAGVCNKEFGMLNAMGFLTPPPSQHSKILVINLPPASPLCLFTLKHSKILVILHTLVVLEMLKFFLFFLFWC